MFMNKRTVNFQRANAYDCSRHKRPRRLMQDAYQPLRPSARRKFKTESEQESKPALRLLVDWPDSVGELLRRVESVTDWGPLELVEATPVTYTPVGARRIFCRFHYHGPEEDREHYEQNLWDLLRPIGDWKPA